jgi:hypothetical protein
VTFACEPTSAGQFADVHSNVFTPGNQGSGVITVQVTNSVTGVTYYDSIPVSIASN